ncbi:uncharacterized protein [Dermacentor andersoni]|uniref:uncharacterized protein isoform X3 n=1 Tax=Dermacentor andersoni TaxID=34620 RepID=UPI0024167549|nr:uncharacterized protein LOC126534369 isoform X3 [Dermacentor andersoni]
MFCKLPVRMTWLLKFTLWIRMVVGMNEVTMADLKSHLATGQKIWIQHSSFKKATYSQRHMCIYFVVTPQVQGQYLFSEHFEVQSRRQKQQFYGSIFEGRQGPTMRVSQRPGVKGTDYTLLFWDARDHCAVFSLQSKERLQGGQTNLNRPLHLATHDRIWTRYRSYESSTNGDKHVCIYLEARNQGHSNYFFTKHYEVGRTWRSRQLYGTIAEGRDGPILVVTSKQGKGSKQCEMRVWGDRVESPVPYCQRAYTQHCTLQYRPYTSYCVQ